MEEKIMKPLKIQQASDFPHDEEVPEGCIVLEDVDDEFGYQVDFKEIVYVERWQDRKKLPLHLHIYQPMLSVDVTTEEERNAVRWPVIVYVQGSAFHSQVMTLHMGMHVRMAERGYLVAVVEYRPSEVAAFPAQVQDCKTAIRFLKKYGGEFHADTDRMALWGDSSGGHTALIAGITGDSIPDTNVYGDCSASVNCIIDWYGPTDFVKMNHYPSIYDHRSADSPEGCEIGGLDVIEHPKRAEECTPMRYLNPERETPPILIMHGGNDMLVPFNQSCLLYEVLRIMGKDVVFMKLDHANHGFNGFNNTRTLDIVEEFIKQYL